MLFICLLSIFSHPLINITIIPIPLTLSIVILFILCNISTCYKEDPSRDINLIIINILFLPIFMIWSLHTIWFTLFNIRVRASPLITELYNKRSTIKYTIHKCTYTFKWPHLIIYIFIINPTCAMRFIIIPFTFYSYYYVFIFQNILLWWRLWIGWIF
jgi:hypothetical protein